MKRGLISNIIYGLYSFLGLGVCVFSYLWAHFADDYSELSSDICLAALAGITVCFIGLTGVAFKAVYAHSGRRIFVIPCILMDAFFAYGMLWFVQMFYVVGAEPGYVPFLIFLVLEVLALVSNLCSLGGRGANGDKKRGSASLAVYIFYSLLGLGAAAYGFVSACFTGRFGDIGDNDPSFILICLILFALGLAGVVFKSLYIHKGARPLLIPCMLIDGLLIYASLVVVKADTGGFDSSGAIALPMLMFSIISAISLISNLRSLKQ